MRTLKLSCSLLIGFGLLINLLFAGAIIVEFHGQPGYNQVTLKWTAQNEINLKGYEVERSMDGEDKDFKKIDFVEASESGKDKKEYTYEDKSVFKSSSSRTFHYRLKIVDNDEQHSYSKTISVTPTVSSARHTWGSIKAMFR